MLACYVLAQEKRWSALLRGDIIEWDIYWCLVLSVSTINYHDTTIKGFDLIILHPEWGIRTIWAPIYGARFSNRLQLDNGRR